MLSVTCAQGQESDSAGMINEELLPGSSVAARVNAAAHICVADTSLTCLIVIPPTAPAGLGWYRTPNNVTVEDLRNRNGMGFPDGLLTGMRSSVHYIYHAGDNEDIETRCHFCGRNVFVVDAMADSGHTTNGNNASLQAIVGTVRRLEGSSRQIWAGNFMASFRSLSEKATGLEVDTANESNIEDRGLVSAGVRIINNGMHTGIGLQINSVVGDGRDKLPAVRGYMIGVDDEDYHTFGLKLSSRDEAHIADLYIVPSNDSEQHTSVIGRNAADNSTRWTVTNDGSASFQRVTSALSVVGGVSNNTGLQHLRGVVGCTTAAATGSTCTSPLQKLAIPFADLRYTISCTLEAPQGLPTVVSVNRQTTGFELQIAALSNVAATGSYNCIAIHD
jgi:hypothetical protein